MMRVHGMKVIYLTAGGLMDALKREYDMWSQKVYHEKSAEVIVPDHELVREGLNLAQVLRMNVTERAQCSQMLERDSSLENRTESENR